MTTKRDYVITLRPASGALVLGEVTNALKTLGYSRAVIFFDITTLTLADGDDEVDFYIQTRYDDVNWVDIENLHYDNANNGETPKRVVGIGGVEYLAADLAITPLDGALADDTKVKLTLGSQLRVKTVITGATAPTYAYAAVVHLSE